MLRIIASLALLAAGALPQTSEAKPKPRIGIQVSLTGPGAPAGQLMRDAIQFANQTVAGGKYELMVEDDRCDGKQAASAAMKLTTVDHVGATLGFCSSSILASGPMYDRAKTLAISFATHPKISGLSPYVFRTAPSDEQAAQLLGRFIEKHYQKIAIVSEQKDFPLGIGNALRGTVHKVDVVEYAEFPSNETDFGSLIARVRNKKPDAIVVFTQDEGSLLRILKAMHAGRLDLPALTAYFPASPTFLAQAGPQSEGMVFAALPPMDSFGTEAKLLFDQFVQKFGPPKTVPHLFFYAYDAFVAAHMALESGTTDIPAYMRNTTFIGSHGPFRFDEMGNSSGIRVGLNRIEKGRLINAE